MPRWCAVPKDFRAAKMPHIGDYGMKTTIAHVDFKIEGDFEGKAHANWLMFYTNFNSKQKEQTKASYVGIMNVDGTIDGKAGTFALEDDGKYEGGLASATLKIIEGSGTGKLKGIKGRGTFKSTTCCTLGRPCTCHSKPCQCYKSSHLVCDFHK